MKQFLNPTVKILLIVVFCTLLSSLQNKLKAQCPDAEISGSNIVCLNDTFSPVNASSNAASYLWDFCGGDLEGTPVNSNLGDPGNGAPSGLTTVENGSDKYLFVTNRTGGDNLVRMDFGTSWANTPTNTNLGNPFSEFNNVRHAMQFVFENNKWTGFVSTSNNRFVRFNFNNGINSAPTSYLRYTNTFGMNLDNPRGFRFVENNDTTFLFIAQLGAAGNNSGKISVYRFQDSVRTTPIFLHHIIIQNAGVNISFEDIELTKVCNNWHAFATSADRLYRIDLGTNIKNPAPTVTEITGTGLVSGRFVHVIYEDDNYDVFVMQGNSDGTKRFIHEDVITDPTPAISNMGNYAGTNGQGFDFRKENSLWYMFSTDRNTKAVFRAVYPDLCATAIPISSLSNPDVIYSSTGNYTATLSAMATGGKIDQHKIIVTVSEKPIANFTAPSGACTGESVSFNDASTYGTVPISTWLWDFGDGNTSVQQNTNHAYIVAGNYSATLTVYNQNGCSSQYSQNITINSNPVAAFTYTGSCQFSPVSFADVSSVNSPDVISSWFWDFGDGNSSTQQNPSNTFTTDGSFNVSLTATSNNGCSHTIISAVSINASPSVSFTADNTCSGDSTEFISSVTISSGTITGYLWDFGDGSTSSQQHPLHFFVTSGNYLVSLTVSASTGCSTSYSTNIGITNPAISNFNFTAACSGSAVQFTDQSTNGIILSWLWDFGDGNSSSVQNPSHIYANAGNYSVTLDVFTSVSCSDDTSINISVSSSPLADFSADTVCLGSPTSFNDMSSVSNPDSIISWIWNFGDGNSSSLQNPSHIYLASGNYSASLTVTSNNGCVSIISQTIIVNPGPDADFSYNFVCQDEPIQFTNQSTFSGGAIVSYLWNFGDGNTSNLLNPDHEYLSQGTYEVTLTVIGSTGCSDVFSDSVSVLQNVIPLYTYSLECVNETLVFDYIENYPVNYSWDFCSGDLSGTPINNSLGNPNGVADGMTGISILKESGNWFGFLATQDNKHLIRYDFGSALNGSVTGNDLGNPSTLINNPRHSLQFVKEGANWSGFLADGTKLIRYDFDNGIDQTQSATTSYTLSSYFSSPRGMRFVTDGAITYLFVCNVTSKKIEVFSFPSTVRTTPTHAFTIDTLSIANLEGPEDIEIFQQCGKWYAFVTTSTKLYRFDFGTSLTNPNPMITQFSGLGMNTARFLRAFYEDNKYYCFIQNGAQNGTYKVVFNDSINNPTPVSTAMGNLSGSNGFGLEMIKDQSNWFMFQVDRLNDVLRRMDFPNNCSATPVISSSSVPSVIYSQLGSYNVLLSATDMNGTTEQYFSSITISENPVASFNYSGLTCENYSLQFNNSSTYISIPITGYNWDFGDGNNSVDQNPVHIFSNEGVYVISLTTINANGCTDTFNDTINIYATPVTSFNSAGGCEEDSILFNNTSNISTPDSITSWLWSFGNGQNSTDENPFAVYNGFGNFSVSLTATSNHGCADSETSSVSILPLADFSIDIFNTCVGDATLFLNNSTVPDSSGIASWFWDFGDGGTSILQSPVHSFLTQQTFNTVITATNNNGCISDTALSVNISTPPVASFGYSQVCVGNPVIFTDNSVAGSSAITAWLWEFGNGDTANGQSPTYAFQNTGTYNVTLTVTSPTDCSDDTTISVVVTESPTADFSADTVCAGNSTSFTDLSSVPFPYTIVTYEWNFGDGSTSNLSNPIHAYSSSGIYSVTLNAISNTGCEGTITMNIEVLSTPQALFTYQINCVDYPVDFMDASTISGATITNWLWDFGDGNFSALQNPSHNYLVPGNYPVTLLVTADNGCAGSYADNVSATSAVVTTFSFNNVCANDTLIFTSTENEPVDYAWDFCSGDLELTPANIPLANPGIVDGMTGMKLIQENNNWYGFTEGQDNNKIVRFNFGNDLTNTSIVATDLGNPNNQINSAKHSMQFVKEGNIYTGFATNNTKLLQYNFDNGIDQLTTAQVSYSAGLNLGTTRGFRFVKEGTSTYLFVANQLNKSVKVYSYSSTVRTTPTFVHDLDSLNNALPLPEDVELIKVCGEWYGFVLTGTSLFRLDFGSSFLNPNPVRHELTVTGLNTARFLRLIHEDGKYYAFIQNGINHGTYLVEFGTDITSMSYTTSYLGNLGGSNGFGFDIAKDESRWVMYSDDRTNDILTQSIFPDSCSATTTVSSDSIPFTTYLLEGSYLVTLATTDLSGNVEHVIDTVTISEAPIVDFDFVTTSCINDFIQFTNLTTTNAFPVASYLWEFGDGSTSALTDPTHTYFSTGIFTVRLTAVNTNGCESFHEEIIQISNKPVPDFSYVASCEDDSTFFTNLSTIISPDSIVSGIWDFGDGTFSTNLNPFHIYNSGGNFLVSLTVYSQTGCSDVFSDNITILSRPVFVVDVINTCLGDNTTFTNNSFVPGGGVITGYQWDFGDGSTSSQINPQHTYSAVGDYTIILIAINSNGCDGDTSFNVHIAPEPVADFSSTNACAGNNISFTDLSTSAEPITEWIWDMGNGDTIVGQNPVYSFPLPGNYNVTLTVVVPTYCDNSITKIVTVIPSPVADFSADTVCAGSPTTFTDLSTMVSPYIIAAWNWDFGDGGTSALQNPQHSFLSAGNHLVTLAVASDSGCTDIISKNVFVRAQPTAAFSSSITCLGGTTNFTNLSFVNGDVITSYLWDFGDAATSNSTNPTHIYASGGEFQVTLTVTTAGGCMDTEIDSIEIFPALVADFSFTEICEGSPVQFTDMSPSFSIIAWSWDFSDGTNSTQQNPSHSFSNPGIYNVSLTVTNVIGCNTTITQAVTVYDIPVSLFTTSNVCYGEPVYFTNNSSSQFDLINQWTWDFGDGTTSNAQEPQHLYTDSGTFTVTLIAVTDHGCTDSYSASVTIHSAPQAAFSYDPPFGQAPFALNFNNLSVDAANYSWDFGDGSTSVAENPAYIFTSNGTYIVTLISSNANGCSDTTTQTILVADAFLDLTVTDIILDLIENPDATYYMSVAAVLANLGTAPVYNFDILATLGDGSTMVEQWNYQFPAYFESGTTMNYLFGAQFFVSSPDVVKFVCVEVQNPNHAVDENPANNENCNPFQGGIQFIKPYPNPADDELNFGVILVRDGTFEVEVFDMLGQQIDYLIYENGVEGLNQVSLSTMALANAAYLLRVMQADDVFVSKFEVQH